MRSTLALSILAIAGVSAAQDSPQNDYPYRIDPQSVSKTDRDTWCDNQKAQCPLICLQQPGVKTMSTYANDCDPEALTYSCICDNQVAPNITQYSQTLPYYICTAWGTNCVEDCNGDNTCASACRADHPCGAQHPDPPNSSIPTTMASTATGSKQTQTGSLAAAGTGADATTPALNNQDSASAMLDIGQSYGLAIVFAGVFAGFAIML